MKTNIDIEKILVDKINKSQWWHVPPQDPEAYSKRGKFLASTYLQAEFYGRPHDIPEKVSISNPVYGFSEEEILKKLSLSKGDMLLFKDLENGKLSYQKRIYLDAQMFKKAKSLGYDAIVLMNLTGKKDIERHRKPRSMELNLLSYAKNL